MTDTLFNIDAEGALVVSERSWDPDQPPAEVRVPASELPALRAILSNSALSSSLSKNSDGTVFFNDLSIIAKNHGIVLKQTLFKGMGGTDNKIELSPSQIWPVIHELSALASSDELVSRQV